MVINCSACELSVQPISTEKYIHKRTQMHAHTHTHTQPFYGPLGFCPGLHG